IGHPLLLLSLTVCTLLISGGFLLTFWRMMHLQHEQQTETLMEIRKFNNRLLYDLQKLVNRSSPQATEDQCQVRFRLRQENGWGYPMEEFALDLYQIQDGETILVQRLETGIRQGMTVDFGLMPPGNYRVDIANSIGMTCQHEFQVLPGVPVDRAILCPYHSDLARHRKPIPLTLDLPWPMEWKSLPIVAVYHLEAKQKKLGRWEWTPSPNHQFRRWVVRGQVPGSVLEERLCEALPESLFAHPLPPNIEGPDVGTIQVPYHHCQVTAISFLLGHADPQKPHIYLGSYAFDDKGQQSVPKFFDSEKTVRIFHPTPCWEFQQEQPSAWEIRLPRQVVQHVLEQAESELRKQESAAHEPVPTLYISPPFPPPISNPLPS
ncbi:MAG: hypothetical protein KDA84_30025, partial [Planctomycetaceae bacterium]|nr:hypothetical protein [Planctomycetaceae bacterium]